MNRYAIYLSGFVFVALVVLFFIIRPARFTQVDDIKKAIPADAALFIETHEFHNLVNTLHKENEVWLEILAIPAMNGIDQLFLLMDSLAGQNHMMEEITGSHNIAFSIHQKKVKGFDYFLIASVSRNVNEKKFREFLASSCPGLKTGKMIFEGKKMVEVSSARSKLFMVFLKNAFLLSSSRELMTRSLRQLEGETNLVNNEDFRKIEMTAGKNVPANLFFRYDNITGFLLQLFHEDHRDYVRQVSTMAQWSALDINLKRDAILMNGFTTVSDSVPRLLEVFSGMKPRKFTIGEVLPANTTAFISLAFGSASEYMTRLNRYLRATGNPGRRLALVDDINLKTSTDIETLFYPLVEHEVCSLVTHNEDLDEKENSYVIIKTGSKSLAEEKLRVFTGSASSKDPGPAMVREMIDEETQLSVYRLPVSYLPAALFGELYKGPGYPFATVYDNYLIFGNTPKALREFVHDNILNRTLINELSYKEISEYLSSEYNFYFYANLPHAEKLVLKYLTGDLSKGFLQYRDVFRKVRGIGCQFSADSGRLYNNLFLKYSPVYTEEAKTLWESLLDTVVLTKPQFVENHNTGEKEIFVQDMKYQAYLINAAGRVLWKIRLAEPIISQIYQIDYYGNNKYQLLFSTRNNIHLIDRNGNNVERYPLIIRAAATNGISLFDYEKNKDYRIFVACADKNIYVYNKEGNLLKDWRFTGTEHVVTQPVNHYRIGDKDYIVFADRMKCYILDRRGNPRVTVRDRFARSMYNNFILEQPKNAPARLVTTDETGKVYFISFSGNIETAEIKKCSPGHYFNYVDLNDDGSKEYIFADGNRLEVYRRNKTLLFSFEFTGTITEPPDIYQFSYNNLKIGVVMPGENRIFLINNNGKLYSGFPLQGRTRFSIGKLKRTGNTFNLIVGNHDNFLLNYTVE